VIQLVSCKCIANLPRIVSGDAPQFQDGRQRFRRGVLPFAGGIGVGGLDADKSGKPMNGFPG
jgi:hypothetical protein